METEWNAQEPSFPKRKNNFFIVEDGVALGPLVEIDIVNTATDITLNSRNELQRHIFVKDGQKAYLKETDEVFQYSVDRNLWLQIKKQ